MMGEDDALECKKAYDRTRFCFRCKNRVYDTYNGCWYCMEARKLEGEDGGDP